MSDPPAYPLPKPAGEKKRMSTLRGWVTTKVKSPFKHTQKNDSQEPGPAADQAGTSSAPAPAASKQLFGE
jgi:hypothetical protein